MARPLVPSDALRGASGASTGRAAPAAGTPHSPANGYNMGTSGSGGPLSQDEIIELAHLRAENGQLQQLCIELEQALQEASQNVGATDLAARIKEYEALLEEKSQTICEMHRQLQESSSGGEPANGSPARGGPAPCEEELLALSEELERERRQLQEDEASLMEQMRAMEVGMARERAEMARQRNDLQRLQAEVRHEIDRLERNGALHSKIESLKTKLQDATARRGAAPGQAANAGQPQQPATSQSTPLPQNKGNGFMGRLFGK